MEEDKIFKLIRENLRIEFQKSRDDETITLYLKWGDITFDTDYFYL